MSLGMLYLRRGSLPAKAEHSLCEDSEGGTEAWIATLSAGATPPLTTDVLQCISALAALDSGSFPDAC